jgi:prepilin-type N-terminal cleavage/methylation domain-containing protein
MRGFTLVELAIVLVIFGLMMAFAVPAVQRMGQTHSLKGARDDIMAQISMARARAMSSGVDQVMHFYVNTYGFDYHMHPAGVTPTVGWNLPKGVTYEFPLSSDMNVTMKANGRADASLIIPLKDRTGQRDTVTVLASGMVVGR